MGVFELLEAAMKLKPYERFVLLDELIKSLDEPDKHLDDIWANEAQKRLEAYRQGKLETVSMEKVFGK